MVEMDVMDGVDGVLEMRGCGSGYIRCWALLLRKLERQDGKKTGRVRL
jgi:hypothetical protein